jgi:hypothetical protein
MVRRGLLWLGVLFILAGVSLPLYVIFVFDYSDREWTPVNVPANLSGQETRGEFTATREDRYEAVVEFAVPSGTSHDDAQDKYSSMLRQPKCGWEHPGLLEIFWAKLNDQPQDVVQSDCWAGINGRGYQDFAVRDLFFFKTEPGQHYTVSARMVAADVRLAKFKPYLKVEAPAVRSEIEGWTLLASIAGMLIGVLVGTPCVIVACRRKRSEYGDSSTAPQ